MMPKGEGQRSMSKQGPNDVIYGFYVSFGFSVLRRSVRTRKAVKHAMMIKKFFKGAINVFGAIVTLKSFNVMLKLSTDECMKGFKQMFDL